MIKNILASLVGLWGKENINITKLHARLILTCKTTNQDDKYNSEMYDKTISILKKIFGMIALPSAMALLNMGEDKIVAYHAS